ALFADPPDAPANLDIAIGIVRIDDRHRHGGALFEIARLHATFRGVHANETIGVIEPHRGCLRRSVRHEGGDDRKRFLALQQVEIVVGNVCHDTSLRVQHSGTRGDSAAAFRYYYSVNSWWRCAPISGLTFSCCAEVIGETGADIGYEQFTDAHPALRELLLIKAGEESVQR